VRRSWLVVFALCLTQPTQAADVQVRVNGALVDVQATAAPLQDVLARLAQQTGMKVVYDGAPPRMLVTLTLAGRTPPEAVMALFEGLGVNYAMMADRTGLRVDTLLITGVSSGTGSGSAGSSASASRGSAVAAPPPEQRQRPQRPAPNEAEPDDDQDDDAAKPLQAPRPAPGNGPVQGGPATPGAPFGGTIAPLVLPTPPLPGLATAPSPSPTPTPNPTRPEDG
jgi:hypothetical protein